MGQAVQELFFLARYVMRKCRQIMHNLRGGSLTSRKHNTTYLTTECIFLAIRSCQARSSFSCLGFQTHSSIMNPVGFQRIFIKFLLKYLSSVTGKFRKYCYVHTNVEIWRNIMQCWYLAGKFLEKFACKNRQSSLLSCCAISTVKNCRLFEGS